VTLRPDEPVPGGNLAAVITRSDGATIELPVMLRATVTHDD
jgi:hypothetical protein